MGDWGRAECKGVTTVLAPLRDSCGVSVEVACWRMDVEALEVN